MRFVAKGHPPTSNIQNSARTYPVNVFMGDNSPEIIWQQQMFLGTVYHWMAPFAPLKKLVNIKNRQEYAAMINFELIIKTLYVCGLLSYAEDETISQSETRMYRDIVDLSAALLNNSPPLTATKSLRLCFDAGVVIALWSVGYKCRDSSIRRKNISLLLTYPRREGICDSSFARRVIECIMNFGEEYAKSGYTSGWPRIRWTMFEVDLERRTAMVEYDQHISNWSDALVT